MIRYFLLTLLVLLSLTSPITVSAAKPHGGGSARLPNIVFILADDLGWADTTLYGHTKLYKTPNIERLAKRGMTFTRAYTASPLCSPTRSSILTGLNPARTGLTTPNCHLPQVVLKATEGTGNAPGKKSVGPTPVSRLDPKYYTLGEALKDAGYATGHFGKWHLGNAPHSPLENGFDVDVPHWHGPGPAGSFVAPWQFPDFDANTPNEHLEDRMAQEAVRFLEQHKDEPFFLNYWMFSVHAPFDAKKDLIEKYRKQVDPKDPQRSPTYAAMIESMDDAVGTLMDTLDRLGLSDNTIVIFCSDNGGNMYNSVDGTSPTSNAPLRGGKASMFEGGVRVPLVISWPGHVKPETRNDTRVSSDDFYPTILEMLNRQPQPGQRFDGVSFLPALKGKTLRRKPSFTYFPHDPPVPDWIPPSVSVHDGDWKLIRIFHGGENGAHRYKLFNLREDIGEQNNLADKEPTRLKRLDGLIESFLNETKAVRPVPNPNFNPDLYRPELEGVNMVGKKPTGKPRKPGKSAAGWQPNHDCGLSVRDGKLVVKTWGGDPNLTYAFPKPLPSGRLTLKITLSSTADPSGELFWSGTDAPLAMSQARSQTFEIRSDGKPHEHRIEFTPTQGLTGIRLDPARSAGEVVVSKMSLHNADGRPLHAWKFAAKTAAKKKNSGSRPNVIVFMTEDQSAHLGCLGTKGLKTPHLDRFAASGANFTRAFALSPVCSPSKMALLTGTYPHGNSALRNVFDYGVNFPLPTDRDPSNVQLGGVHEDLPTLIELLRENGVYTGVSSKTHVQPIRKFPYHHGYPNPGTPRDAANMVKDIANRAGADGSPYFLWLNIGSPHLPFPNVLKANGQWDPRGGLIGDGGARNIDPASINVPACYPDVPAVRQDIADYYGNIQIIDDIFQGVIDTLKEQGQLDNTLVLFTSDHGIGLHRAKQSMYGLQVPLLVRAPDRKAGLRIESPISHLDLSPTILDYLSIPTPDTMIGRSLRPILSGVMDAFADRPTILTACHRYYHGRGVTDGRWYYIRNLTQPMGGSLQNPQPVLNTDQYQPGPPWFNRTYPATVAAEGTRAHELLRQIVEGKLPTEELYDLNSDPWMVNNLVADPKHRARIAKFKADLNAWRNRTGDHPRNLKRRTQPR